MGDPSSPLFLPNDTGDPFDLIGDTIDGQFLVESVVGDGDLSVVYRGRHKGIDAPIVIKCLNLPPTLDAKLVEPFVESFRAGARIHYKLAQGHLNIVQSLGCGTTLAPRTGVAVPYLVREWLDGVSLAEDLAARRRSGRGKRTIHEVLELLDAAADALGYAHAQGVMHHGISPRNLFVADTPRGTMVKILDFGVAHALHEQSVACALPEAEPAALRVILPAYAAPEQLDRSFGEPGLPTDVYAFALVVNEALAGEAVIPEGAVVTDVIHMLRLDARLHARWVGMPVHRDVQEVLTRALALSPDGRYPNMRAFWNDLMRAASRHALRTGGASARKPPPLPLAPPSPPIALDQELIDQDARDTAMPGPPPEAMAALAASARPTSAPRPRSDPSITAQVAPPVAAPSYDAQADDAHEAPPFSAPDSDRLAPPPTAGRAPDLGPEHPLVRRVSFAAAAIAVALGAVFLFTRPRSPLRAREYRAVAVHSPKVQEADASTRRMSRFDVGLARAALDETAAGLKACDAGWPRGPGSVRARFNPSDGRVTRLMIGPPYRNTATGRCILEHYRETRVAPFSGTPIALNHVFLSIPF